MFVSSIVQTLTNSNFWTSSFFATVNIIFYLTFQVSRTYTCTHEGKVICLDGWSDPKSLCSIPVCQFHSPNTNETLTCDHGTCVHPNTCACEIGWEGSLCDICIPLPGCVHGNCSEALECNCFDGWDGAFCDIRKYI